MSSGEDGPFVEGPVPHDLIVGLWHHIVELDLEPDALALTVPPEDVGGLVEASLQLIAFLAFLTLHLNQPNLKGTTSDHQMDRHRSRMRRLP